MPFPRVTPVNTPESLAVNQVVRIYGREPGWLRPGNQLRAVDDVSFSLRPRETLGVVGESGSGKSTLGRIAAGIEAPNAGTVRFRGQPYAPIGSRKWRHQRRAVQVIFQNPSRALDPRLAIGVQIHQAMSAHRLFDEAGRKRRVEEMLALVGLPGLAHRYPHQLSGGQLQRSVIARALVLEPEIVVCDEAVSALDVSVQAQIINLLKDLQAALGLAYLFISHDLGVVRNVSHRIAVMQRGRVVEMGEAGAVFASPQHPYTQALLTAMPAASPAERRIRDAASAAHANSSTAENPL